MCRDHVILVPGFGGFDALGALHYYEQSVLQLLQQQLKGWPIHFFPNLPTAAVRTRAQALVQWIEKRVARQSIGPEDGLHLIGHSTGALDIRVALFHWSDWTRIDRPAVRSVQSLSGPHRGTQLAARTHVLARCTARVAGPRLCGLMTLRNPGPRAALCLATQLRFACRTRDWTDAVLESLLRAGGDDDDAWTRARSREELHDLLAWLDDMCEDQHALEDLIPDRPDAAYAIPDTDLYEPGGIEARSIVTASAPCGQGLLYRLLYRGVARGAGSCLMPDGHRGPLRIPWLLQPERMKNLVPCTNDGIVNSPSMIWPDLERSFFVEADHADVLGHYDRPSACRCTSDCHCPSYDLLRSGAAFERPQLQALWQDVARFMLARETGQPRPGPSAER